MLPQIRNNQRNNSSNISSILGQSFLDDIEEQRSRPSVETRIELSTMYEEKIQNLELRLREYEDTNIQLQDENEKLKENLSKLMLNLPKEFIFKKVLGDKCAICLEDYKLNDDIAITNCLHVFHKNCIDRSIDSSNNCPKCRFDMTGSVFMYLKCKLEFGETDFL